MVITIMAEPRSGSTNLAHWFSMKKEFTVLYEPMTDSKLKTFKGTTPPTEWKYNTPHMLVKEIYNYIHDFSELIRISDKVIILYRENSKEQLLSWKNAIITDNWTEKWAHFNENSDIYENVSANHFFDVKNGIKENYLDKDYFRISYEDLYYNDGFQKIVDYLNIDCVENVNFPYGEKYRVDINNQRTLI